MNKYQEEKLLRNNRPARFILGVFTLVLLICEIYPNASYGQSVLRDNLFSITFPDARFGWACGGWGTVVHTRDVADASRRQCLHDSAGKLTLLRPPSEARHDHHP